MCQKMRAFFKHSKKSKQFTDVIFCATVGVDWIIYPLIYLCYLNHT